MPFLAAIGIVSVGACHVRTVQVREVAPVGDVAMEDRLVTHPVKAHLVDGRTVLFQEGVRIGQDSLYGFGLEYDLALSRETRVSGLALESVAAMEVYQGGTDYPESAFGTLILGGLSLVGAAAAALVIFGSCPTVYAAVGDVEPQAELFSYSIAPRFEGLDADLLIVVPNSDGEIRLVVANEALETHYIDDLQVREVALQPGERVVITPDETPLAIGELTPALTAGDRAGRDVRKTLLAADEAAVGSATEVLRGATAADANEIIELEFELAPDAGGAVPDSTVLALRMRNSLLSTVLFYDVMLAAQGPDALNWLAGDLSDDRSALDLYLWTVGSLGLLVEVWDGERYLRVRKIPDSGPIAWDEIGLVVPVPTADRLRLRLSFLADSWRIDRVALAAEWRRPKSRLLPLDRVVERDGRENPEARSRLRAVDDDYLVTTPGQYFEAVFSTRPPGAEASRAYVLEATGYYTEWIRGSWLRRTPRPFVPDRTAIDRTLRLWERSRDSLEVEFFRRRIPIP